MKAQQSQKGMLRIYYVLHIKALILFEQSLDCEYQVLAYLPTIESLIVCTFWLEQSDMSCLAAYATVVQRDDFCCLIKSLDQQLIIHSNLHTKPIQSASCSPHSIRDLA